MKFLELGEVRAVKHDGAVWFAAKDVCSALGYKCHKTAVSARVDPSNVKVIKIQTQGGPQGVTHVNEAGLYALVLGSDTEPAKAFAKWVASSVLPKWIDDEIGTGQQMLIDVFSSYKKQEKGRSGRPRKLAGIVEPGDENDIIKRFVNVIRFAGSIKETELFRMFPEEEKGDKTDIIEYLMSVGRVKRVFTKGPVGVNRAHWIIWNK